MEIENQNGWPILKIGGIVVTAHPYVPNPRVYASCEAYEFLYKLLDEREKLIEVLKYARRYKEAAMSDDNNRSLYLALKACSDIKIEGET